MKDAFSRYLDNWPKLKSIFNGSKSTQKHYFKFKLYVLLLVLKFDQQHLKSFLLMLMSFKYVNTVFDAIIIDYISTKFDPRSC